MSPPQLTKSPWSEGHSTGPLHSTIGQLESQLRTDVLGNLNSSVLKSELMSKERVKSQWINNRDASLTGFSFAI